MRSKVYRRKWAPNSTKPELKDEKNRSMDINVDMFTENNNCLYNMKNDVWVQKVDMRTYDNICYQN